MNTVQKQKRVFLLLLALLAGSACASETNIVLYGWLDTGYVRENSHDLRMDQNRSNTLGIKGSESLSRDITAIFELQKRFQLNTGENRSSQNLEFEGAANIGLATRWGNIRLGRVNDVSTETFRVIDPFNQDGLNSMLRSSQRIARISNTVRYDSPSWNGLYLRTSYSTGEDIRDNTGTASAAGANNNGYAASLHYDHGPLILLGSWSRRADSNGSSLFNVGGAYSCGEINFSLGYERTLDNGWQNGDYSNPKLAALYGGTEGVDSTQESIIAGINWDVGTGTINALYSYARLKDATIMKTSHTLDDEYARKYALGYRHNLSRRTYFYSMVSYADYQSETIASFYRGGPAGEKNITTLHIGMFHNF